MDGLLLRNSSADSDPEPLLSVSSTRRLAPPAPSKPAAPDLSSDAAILRTLQSDPSYDAVVEILQRLSSSTSIKTANPTATRILRCLLDTTLPNFTDALDKKQRRQLAECLASAVGLSAAVGRIKTLLPAVRDKAEDVSRVERKQLGDVLELAQTVLGRRGFTRGVWSGIKQEAEPKRGLLWREFIGLIGSGKLLGIAAEAEVALGRNFDEEAEGGMRWIGDGPKYAVWLGKELAEMTAGEEVDDQTAKAMAQLLAGSFRLGYTDQIVETFTFRLLYPTSSLPALLRILPLLPDHDKRTYLTTLLRVLATTKLNAPPILSDKTWWKHDAPAISGASALLDAFVSVDDSFRETLLGWLISSSGGGVGQPIGIRRAVVQVVAKDPMSFRSLFEKNIQQFADKLWIKHTPVLRQEVNVQVLLLCAGWAERNSPKILERLKKSPDFLNGVSNRLGALSSQRARFLGMIVAEAFSQLGDDAGIKLNFDVDETQTEEALWWKSIPSVEDTITTISDLFTTLSTALSPAPQRPTSTPQPSSTAPITPAEEDDDSDDEFQPYTMPSNAPPPDSDDDEPPNRNKPSPPVYIRDLLAYLQKTDSYDHISLALQHAAPLIRRKIATPPPKDLSSHLLPILNSLMHLQDAFEISGFAAMKRAGCVALVVAQPDVAAPALIASIFENQLGLSTKLELLNVLALAARELGGIDRAPEASAAAAIPNRYYGSNTALLADQIQTSILAPRGSKQAEGLPRELSTRRFFGPGKTKTAVRPMHQYAGPAFLYPLTARFWLAARDNTARPYGLGDKTLLSALINTGAVVVYSAGPSCPGLVDMVREFWGMMSAVKDRVVEAVLGGLCVVLETMMADGVEGRRRVAEEFGRELGETQEWVSAYFDESEEGRGRMLAAGVLVRIGEVMEEWRSLVLGGVGIEY